MSLLESEELYIGDVGEISDMIRLMRGRKKGCFYKLDGDSIPEADMVRLRQFNIISVRFAKAKSLTSSKKRKRDVFKLKL
jgi:hypothetical protein